jgi:hypothetical protein
MLPVQWVPLAVPGVKSAVTRRLHSLQSSLGMMELYLHSPIRLNGVMINFLCFLLLTLFETICEFDIIIQNTVYAYWIDLNQNYVRRLIFNVDLSTELIERDSLATLGLRTGEFILWSLYEEGRIFHYATLYLDFLSLCCGYFLFSHARSRKNSFGIILDGKVYRIQVICSGTVAWDS